ncbi:hypothetical protein GSU68_18365 (plasmid) [Rathayibacter sp. VKM Ac-2759]|uniref:hypothetical protein n=1 Tax=Rathayibacter sp. VKM Ac-2759 TaxID=2609252 RepID=UPI00131634AC|nr:hypothetical protein [Rathayibacter sp. VKM Ac-2759]QHC68679.1 hypothetical protein GSU68_18365 [Rathayibacter sp. VKM Ac-2759]
MILDAIAQMDIGFLLAATPNSTPSPSPSPTPAPFNNDTVTPGLFGFLATGAVAVAVVALSVDMNRRVRRVRYRELISEELDREERQMRSKDEQNKTDSSNGES